MILRLLWTTRWIRALQKCSIAGSVIAVLAIAQHAVASFSIVGGFIEAGADFGNGPSLSSPPPTITGYNVFYDFRNLLTTPSGSLSSEGWSTASWNIIGGANPQIVLGGNSGQGYNGAYDPGVGYIYGYGFSNFTFTFNLDQPYTFTSVSSPVNVSGVSGASSVQLRAGNYSISANAFGNSPGSFSANFKLTPVQNPQSFTPPPTPQIAAALSSNIYNGTIGYNGYTIISNVGLSTDPANAGYLGQAYANGDPTMVGTQIIVAFQGTQRTQGAGVLWSDVQADGSFITNTPSVSLTQQVLDAANYVRYLQATYPNASITLTGQSLGGALAQFVGKASGLTTYAIDAPGGGQLYSSLTNPSDNPLGTNVLGSFRSLPDIGPNTNYREYGDAVSQAGTPVGATVTLGRPPTTVYTTLLTDPGQYVLNNLTSLVQAHDPTIAFQQINTISTESASTEPNVGPVLNNVITPAVTAVSNVFSFLSTINDDPADPTTLFDPPSGTDFILTRDASSPGFDSICFPTLDGVASYQSRYEVNGLWSSWQSIAPGAESLLGVGTTAVEFGALDASVQLVNVTDFLFGLTFNSAGTFSGSITTNEVPEPASITLVAIGTSILLFRRRRSPLIHVNFIACSPLD